MYIVDLSAHFSDTCPVSDISITKVKRDSFVPEPAPYGLAAQMALIGEVEREMAEGRKVIVTYHMYGSDSFSGSTGAAHIECMTNKKSAKRSRDEVHQAA